MRVKLLLRGARPSLVRNYDFTEAFEYNLDLILDALERRRGVAP